MYKYYFDIKILTATDQLENVISTFIFSQTDSTVVSVRVWRETSQMSTTQVTLPRL